LAILVATKQRCIQYPTWHGYSVIFRGGSKGFRGCAPNQKSIPHCTWTKCCYCC